MNTAKLINEFFDVKLNKAIESDVRDDEILDEQESTHSAEFEKNMV